MEAFAGLSQILSFYPAPKTEITQVGLLDSLTSQYKSVFGEGKASVDLQELMVTQSVQFLHQIGPEILLAQKDHALLRSIVDFFAKIIGTLEQKSATSLAAELKLPELPIDELYNARKMSGKSKSIKGTKTDIIDEKFDYWQQE